MEEELRMKIESGVLEILKQSNMGESTEFTVRVAASRRLGIDLSPPERKQLVRTVLESYLLSLADDIKNDTVLNHNAILPHQHSSHNNDNSDRILCQLSDKRNVSIGKFKGSTMVSIREFFCKDGKQIPGPKGINLTTEQWSAFKKSVPAIEEAIAKMKRKMGYDLNGKQNGDVSNSAADVAPLELVSRKLQSTQCRYNLHGNQNGNVSNSSVDVAPLEHVPRKMQSTQCRYDLHGKQNGYVSNSAVDVAPLGLAPIEVVRFNGKNYQFWAEQMELLLKQLKIDYVLTEPCPSSTLAENSSAEAKAAEKRWVNDDLLCQRNILNHLSDSLFNLYANRRMSAKELWEELKQVYMFEKFGTKRSLVKTYIEFKIVEEKAITEQIQELNAIADSLDAEEMPINENFHVSVIISKLPLSWKNFCIKLMCEEHLRFWKLMEYVRKEEESRNGVKQSGDPSYSTESHRTYKFQPRRTENKQPPGKSWNKSETNNAKSIPCDICGKKGHLTRNCWGRKQGNERKAQENLLLGN